MLMSENKASGEKLSSTKEIRLYTALKIKATFTKAWFWASLTYSLMWTHYLTRVTIAHFAKTNAKCSLETKALVFKPAHCSEVLANRQS